jgi:hypothetical protein
VHDCRDERVVVYPSYGHQCFMSCARNARPCHNQSPLCPMLVVARKLNGRIGAGTE